MDRDVDLMKDGEILNTGASNTRSDTANVEQQHANQDCVVHVDDKGIPDDEANSITNAHIRDVNTVAPVDATGELSIKRDEVPQPPDWLLSDKEETGANQKPPPTQHPPLIPITAQGHAKAEGQPVHPIPDTGGSPIPAQGSIEPSVSVEDCKLLVRKPSKVTFTVTKVDEPGGSDGAHSSRESLQCEGSVTYTRPEEQKRSSPQHGESRGQTHEGRPPLRGVRRPDSLQMSGGAEAGGAGVSDNESSWGDTLTQTSLTKLLSKKFKSYRTYRYNLSVQDRKTCYRKRLHSKYESQDYDQIENVLFLKEQEKGKSKTVRRKWMARWIVSFLIGIGTAVVATVIEILIEFTAEYKFLALRKLLERCEGGTCMAVPLLVWVTINGFLVFLGSMLVTYVEPQAAGSGIPQIKCYLNGVKIPGLLTLRALAAKAIGVILSVAGGLACGKEGPMIHSGAIVASGVSQGRSRFFKKDFKVFEYLRSDTERRDFVSGGAAAGVSAAFGAPVGGVLFSLEEGASFWNQSLTWRIVFASMVATFGVNVLISAIHGHPADLSNPGLISFGQFADITYQAIEIPIFVLMAVFGGLSGALYNFINCKLTVFRKKYIQARWLKVAEAVIVASVSAAAAFALIFICKNDCAPSQNTHEESHTQLHCPEGKHNVMSHLFFKTPESTLTSVLHDDANSYSAQSLALFTVLYWILACWTYGLSVSSGVFIPSLLTGAAWGRLVGMGVLYVFPKMGYDYGDLTKSMKSNNLGKYALIGAACQLGGTVRMTISLTVILIESTGDITFGLPIVMALTIAKWVGDFFNTGLYDLHIQMMGIPLLPWEPPEMSYDIRASQVMNKPVVVLRTVEKVKRILEVMINMPHLHSAFPVVTHTELLHKSGPHVYPLLADERPCHHTNRHPPSRPGRHYNNNESGIFEEDIEEVSEGEEGGSTTPHTNGDISLGIIPSNMMRQEAPEECFGRCEGLILRSQLVLLLKHKIFTYIINDKPAEVNSLLKLEDFRDAYPQYTNFDISLTEEEQNSYIDLRPYMNPTPYTVTKQTSLPRMFKLFRGLGLRHLIVVNNSNQVVGVVTRKDLAKYRLHKNWMNIKVQELQIHGD